MSLARYTRKRNFQTTPEPRGSVRKDSQAKAAPARDSFVVQKHDASHLHYDLRLEMAGVLKSWAVPKGPSLDPSVARLAVEVEDHPVEYGDFEGTIPKGQYGGGTVMVWDRGRWSLLEGDSPEAAHRAGKIKFELRGDKLRGGWMLVRTRTVGDKQHWLLRKLEDDHASAKTDVAEALPLSVKTGRDLDQIAAGRPATKARSRKNATKSAHSSKLAPTPTPRGNSSRSAATAANVPGALQVKQPKELPVQLAVPITAPPAGPGWTHEVKFDGYRMLAFIEPTGVRLISRNGKDWTARFPTVADAVSGLGWQGGIIDGEIIALDARGISNFQSLQNAIETGTDAVAYCVFDLPWADGYDLRGAPLSERRKLLEAKLPTAATTPGSVQVLRLSRSFDVDGAAMLAEACRLGIEGVVSKKTDSVYHDRRHASWVKCKCGMRQEFVIGGYTSPNGSRVGFGSLLLGYHDKGSLMYAGNVGTGFDHRGLKELAATLKSLETETCPYGRKPASSLGRVMHWVKPKLVAEVAFTEWTRDGHLRHPSFLGLREDKPAGEIIREHPVSRANVQAEESHPMPQPARAKAPKPTTARSTAKASAEASVLGIAITHPDRVVYPDSGLTKLDIARYYEIIAERMLPHVVGRPLSVMRCPEGLASACFVQKHLTLSSREGLHEIPIKESKGVGKYVVIDSAEGMVSLVQNGVLEIHPWGCLESDLERADRLVIDLDPGEEVTWPALQGGAVRVREILESAGLRSFVRTTGGKGLHVVAPLAPAPWSDVKAFARAVAGILVAEAPDRYLDTMTKSARTGRIFIDYLRNQRGATAIATYSTRARPGAPVAVPLPWSVIERARKRPAFTIDDVATLTRGRDPWIEISRIKQKLPSLASPR